MLNNSIKFKTICRLCTKNYTQLSSVYECDMEGISSEEKLKTICGIEIGSEDVLPKNICTFCNKKLNNSFEFRSMCLDSIHTLAKYVEDCTNGTNEQKWKDDNVLYYLEVDEDWLAENNCGESIIKASLEDYDYIHDHSNDNNEDDVEYLEDDFLDLKPDTCDSDDVDLKNTEESVVPKINSNCTVKKYKHNSATITTTTTTTTKKTKKCRVCKKRFNSDTKVKLHMQRIHKEIYLAECKVSCYKCGMKFQHMRNLKRHMVYHNITFSYFECNFCQKKLYSKKSWRKHIKLHDKSINEICKICNKRLCSSVGKIYHMDYHRTKETLANKTYYCCHSCNLNFTSFEELETHSFNVHSVQNARFDEIERNIEKIFSDETTDEATKENKTEEGVNVVLRCNLCSLFYKKLPELKYHVSECFAKIDRPKSFMCDTCGKCFKSSWLLNNHKAGHSSLRKFICDICGQRFKWHNDLTNHVSRIHENIRPYVCKFCGKTCGTSATLKSHLRSHSKERPYTCKVCDTSFAQNSSLKEHMFKHTGGQEGTCPICNKLFKTPLRLRTHMKRHNTQRVLYPCDLCGRMFTEKSSVKKHKIKIHNDSTENTE